jgi:hypothetical protein
VACLKETVTAKAWSKGCVICESRYMASTDPDFESKVQRPGDGGVCSNLTKNFESKIFP